MKNRDAKLHPYHTPNATPGKVFGVSSHEWIVWKEKIIQVRVFNPRGRPREV